MTIKNNTNPKLKVKEEMNQTSSLIIIGVGVHRTHTYVRHLNRERERK